MKGSKMAKRAQRQPGRRRAAAVRPPDQLRRELIVVLEEPAEAIDQEGRLRAGAGPAPLRRLLARSRARLVPLFVGLPNGLQDEAPLTSMRAGAHVPQREAFFRVDAPPATLDDLAGEIVGQPRVLGAYVKPAAELPRAINKMTASPASPPPTSPSFTAQQGYLSPSPTGVDAWFAWTHAGGRGENVRIIDIEGGWRFSHEDLAQNQGGLAGGTMLDEVSWRNHGTAVMGEIGGDDNPFGVTGIAPAANLKAISHWPIGSAAAIDLAATMLRPGDVLLLEMHRPGPRFNYELRPDQRGFIAVEWWPDDYAAILAATAKGIIVVEAAGNGAESLDDPIYDTPAVGFPQTWRNPFRRSPSDSGALIVGAGAPPPGTHGRDHGPDRSRLDFSNHGECVDCQGWGREVTTTGYGDLQGGPNEDLWYTDTFSGTSSASPIVTGAIACVQGARRAKNVALMTPATARKLLRTTGAAQTAGPNGSGRIGTRPNLRELLASLGERHTEANRNRPVVSVASYDAQLRAGGLWRAVIDDAANPGQRVIVEFVNSSLHVTWKNAAGEDRTKTKRNVRIG